MDAYQKSMLELVKTALYEDVGKGDLTSLACLEPGPVTATIVAKSTGVLSGVEPAFLTFDIVDSANKVEFLKRDGDRFEPGTVYRRDRRFQTCLSLPLNGWHSIFSDT